jgi:hypothetical protein
MFMARYVNLMDTAIQNFSSELASFHTDRDPIRRARSSLRGKMSEDIKRIMRDIDYDVMPNLPLPPRLTEQDRNTGGGKKGKTRDHREKDQESDSERQDSPSWWKKNPSPLSEWALPSGSKFQDSFDPSSVKEHEDQAKAQPLRQVPEHGDDAKKEADLVFKGAYS